MTMGAQGLYDYTAKLRTELRRLGVYRPNAPADAYPRVARGFMGMEVAPTRAAEWIAAGLGPSAAGPLIALGMTPEQWRSYADRLHTEADQLHSPDLALDWIAAGVPAEDAVAWANLGYVPEGAAPLIAQGITPDMASALDDASAAVARSSVLHLAEQMPGLVIDPDLADRLGLDHPQED